MLIFRKHRKCSGSVIIRDNVGRFIFDKHRGALELIPIHAFLKGKVSSFSI